MQLFFCQHCSNAVHFDNDLCLSCGHRLGYLQDELEMVTLEKDGQQWVAPYKFSQRYIFCDNAELGVCNWLLPSHGQQRFCEACRHNLTIPDLSAPENQMKWRKIELAKRYVFRSLMRWGLPMPSREEDPNEGLAFEFLSDVKTADGKIDFVKTGHDAGLITINIAEADDAEREKRRVAMGETYRTLVGHFRHEVAHYYWDRLVRDSSELERCRMVFGDERQDYAEALKRHYQNGPPVNWQNAFITSYATSHPWEDFAETWAHYIHMVDAIETARSYGINIRSFGDRGILASNSQFEPYFADNAQMLVDAWIPLTIAVNGLNRSMGQPDLYPFVLSEPVVEKLQFIHELIHGARVGIQPVQQNSAAEMSYN